MRNILGISRTLLVSMLLLFCLACNRDSRILPNELVGHWTTTSPGYQGRFLELSQAYVIIGAGAQGSPEVQTVNKVSSEPSDSGTAFTIYSVTPRGIQEQITLQFTPRNGGEIRIKNRDDVVWKRSEDMVP